MLEAAIAKELAEKPIRLPHTPYVAKLLDFGVDEGLAAGIDPISTFSFSRILAPSIRNYALPFVGPVCEKFVFLARHAYNARNVYNTTPEHMRREYSYYFKKGVRHGLANLIKDIVYHDPVYIALMGFGLKYTEIEPFMLSALSYTLAVFGAAALDVGRDEFMHDYRKRKLHKLGFQEESYFESRFYVLNEMNPQTVVENIMKRFNLGEAFTSKYNDTYVDNKIPAYSGRVPKIRLRTRNRRDNEKDNSWGTDGNSVSSLQIIYTRAIEQKKGLDQVRYFPTKKEKLYLLLDNPLTDIRNIQDPALKEHMMKLMDTKAGSHNLSFERTVAHNDELAVCTDKLDVQRPFYVLELKTYKDTKLLQQVMRYLMVECPIAVMQTTHGKSDLIITS